MADAVVRMGYNDADLQRGLQRSAASARRFAEETKGSFGGLSGMMRGGLAGGIAGVGVGAALAGMKRLAEEFDRIGDLAQQLGESPETMQRVGAMAKLSASDVESVAKALNRVNKEIAQGKAGNAFAELGLKAADYLKLDAEDQILALAAAFQNAEANGRGLAAAYDLFGKSAAELLPLLRSNVESLTAASQINVITDEQMASLQEFQDRWDRMVLNAKATLAGLAVETTNWLSDLKEGLGTWLDDPGDQSSLVDDIAEARNEREDSAAQEQAAADAEREKKREAQAAADANERAEKAVTNEADECERLEKLSQQIAQDAERRANAAAAAAAAAAREKQEIAKQRDSRLESIRDLETEMKILELRARGRNKEADALEREARIKQEAQRIAKETGLDPAKALEVARRKADLEDRAEGRPAGRIRGYSREQREQNPWINRSRLDEWKRDSTTPFWQKHGRTPNLDAHPWKRQTAAAKEGSRTVEQKLDLLIENTAPIKDY